MALAVKGAGLFERPYSPRAGGTDPAPAGLYAVGYSCAGIVAEQGQAFRGVLCCVERVAKCTN